MNIKRISISISISFFLFVSLFAFKNDKKPNYVVKSVQCGRVEMNNDWDEKAKPEIKALIESYKLEIDSVMNVKIGKTDQDMVSAKPESLLSNFTADILRNAATAYIDRPADIAIMNNGGLRSSLNKGEIRVADIYKIFPFENELVILKLKGSDLEKLFSVIAADGGIGISGVKMIISKSKNKSTIINGQPIDAEKDYFVATIDYLADGNGGMQAMTKAIDRIMTGKKLRDVMIDVIKESTASGKLIHSELDKRISIEN